MQARIADYRPEHLHERLYGEGVLVEAWDKLRSIVRADDWPYLWAFRRRIWEHYTADPNPPRDVIIYVREEMKRRGRVTSLDLEDRGSTDWRWAPAKAVRAALEIMFDWGEIGIAGRQGTRKVYAPIEKIVGAVDAGTSGDVAGAADGAMGGATGGRAVTAAQRRDYVRRHVLQRLHAVGLAAGRSGDTWLGIDRMNAAERNEALTHLVESGAVQEIRVEGVRAPCFVPVSFWDADTWADDTSGAIGSPHAVFIAPLDNVMWDRRLIAELFGFSYRWEVYKPAREREYGSTACCRSCMVTGCGTVGTASCRRHPGGSWMVVGGGCDRLCGDAACDPYRRHGVYALPER